MGNDLDSDDLPDYEEVSEDEEPTYRHGHVSDLSASASKDAEEQDVSGGAESTFLSLTATRLTV